MAPVVAVPLGTRAIGLFQRVPEPVPRGVRASSSIMTRSGL
jgi:hypothetical protein